jgi:hypothetical protein
MGYRRLQDGVNPFGNWLAGYMIASVKNQIGLFDI